VGGSPLKSWTKTMRIHGFPVRPGVTNLRRQGKWADFYAETEFIDSPGSGKVP